MAVIFWRQAVVVLVAAIMMGLPPPPAVAQGDPSPEPTPSESPPKSGASGTNSTEPNPSPQSSPTATPPENQTRPSDGNQSRPPPNRPPPSQANPSGRNWSASAIRAHLRLEDSAGRPRDAHAVQVSGDPGRGVISLRVPSQQDSASQLYLEQAWFTAEVVDFAATAPFGFVSWNGTSWIRFEAPPGAQDFPLEVRSFQLSKEQPLYSMGSNSSVRLLERPMWISLVWTPHVEAVPVETVHPNGTTTRRHEFHDYHSAAIGLEAEDSSGQPVVLNERWLESFHLTNYTFHHHDGRPIDYERTPAGDYLLRPQHFSHLVVNGSPTATPSAATRLLGGEVGVWQMDADDHNVPVGGVTRDASGHANDATLVDTPTQAAGQFGNAYQFGWDGTRGPYLHRADSDTLDVTGSLTVMAWVKFDAFANTYAILIKGRACGSSTTCHWNYALDYDYGNNRFRFIGQTSSAATAFYVTYNRPASITTGTWHHYAGIVNQATNTAYIYVDGAQVASAALVGTFTSNNYELTIGAAVFDDCVCAQRHLPGVIDDARVYNRALGQADLDSIRNNPYNQNSGDPSGPPRLIGGEAGLWQLDSDDHDLPGPGETRDSSPYANSLTRVGTVTQATGRFGAAYDFAEAGYLHRWDTGAFDRTGSLTVMAWAKFDAFANTYAILIKGRACGGSSTCHWNYALDYDYGNNRFRFIGQTASTTTAFYVTYNRPASITTGSWHHYAGVVNLGTNTAYIFVDGSQVASAALVGTVAANDFELSVGGAVFNDCNCAMRLVDGIIDEVRLYDHALSVSEIADIKENPYASGATPTVTLSLTGSPMVEAGGTATVTATASATSSQTMTINLAFSGTAILTNDYTRSGTSISIPPGATAGSISLTAVQDGLDEVDETVVLDIDTVVNAAESGTQQVTATIRDDDGPSVTLGLSGSPMAEAGGTATVTAGLSATSPQTVTVSLAFSGTATFPGDYTRSGTSISIPSGSPSGSVTLTAVQDALNEPSETIVVDVSSVTNGFESGIQQVTATIIDANQPPNACIGGPSPGYDLTVTVSSCSTDPDGDPIVSVSWSWGDGTPNSAGSPQTHTYACPGGSFTITLTVSDGLPGGTSSTTKPVTPGADADGDGLKNCQETGTYQTNPNIADTDGDGLNDGLELTSWNGIGPNAWNTNYNHTNRALTNNLLKFDADGDGIRDGHEFQPPSEIFGTGGGAQSCFNVGGRNECPTPTARDLYVQLQWMDKPSTNCFAGFCLNPGHSDGPSSSQIQTFRNNFATWNAGRPDIDDINLHLYVGPNGDGQGAWGAHTDSTTFASRAGSWNDFYDWKTDAMPAARLAIFHFTLFGHNGINLDGTSCGCGGLGEAVGDDAVVYKAATGSGDQPVVGTWMQEVGHNTMGYYHSICTANNAFYNGNPDANHLTDGNGNAGGIDEGRNSDGTCGITDGFQDVSAHSSLPDDAMGFGITYAADSWLDFMIWKGLDPIRRGFPSGYTVDHDDDADPMSGVVILTMERLNKLKEKYGVD